MDIKVKDITPYTDIKVKDITLLSVEEVEKVPKEIRKFYSEWWWLRSVGCNQHFSASVDGDGLVDYDGVIVNSEDVLVRPVIVCENLESIKDFEEIEFCSIRWIKISENMLLCDDYTFGEYCFDSSESWDWENPNCTYENSDIYRYIHDEWNKLSNKGNIKESKVNNNVLSSKEFSKLLEIDNGHAMEESDILFDAFVDEFNRLGLDTDSIDDYSSAYARLDNKGKLKLSNLIKSFDEDINEDIGMNIKVKDITLLSKEEAKKVYKEILKFNKTWWWLRSPGLDQDFTAGINRGGSIDYGGDVVYYDDIAVRPALICENLDSIQNFEKIEYCGVNWVKISSNMLLCNDDTFGKHCFDSNEDWDWEDPECTYENSDIYKYIHDKWNELSGHIEENKQIKESVDNDIFSEYFYDVIHEFVDDISHAGDQITQNDINNWSNQFEIDLTRAIDQAVGINESTELDENIPQDLIKAYKNSSYQGKYNIHDFDSPGSDYNHLKDYRDSDTETDFENSNYEEVSSAEAIQLLKQDPSSIKAIIETREGEDQVVGFEIITNKNGKSIIRPSRKKDQRVTWSKSEVRSNSGSPIRDTYRMSVEDVLGIAKKIYKVSEAPIDLDLRRSRMKNPDSRYYTGDSGSFYDINNKDSRGGVSSEKVVFNARYGDDPDAKARLRNIDSEIDLQKNLNTYRRSKYMSEGCGKESIKEDFDLSQYDREIKDLVDWYFSADADKMAKDNGFSGHEEIVDMILSEPAVSEDGIGNVFENAGEWFYNLDFDDQQKCCEYAYNYMKNRHDNVDECFKDPVFESLKKNKNRDSANLNEDFKAGNYLKSLYNYEKNK